MPPNNSHVRRTITPDDEVLLALDFNMEEIPVTEPEEPFITVALDILPNQLDCITWNRRHSLFSFGSYEIHSEDRSRRLGKVYLAKLTQDLPIGYRIEQTLEDLPGILDMKWEPIEEQKLVIATSESVILFELEISQNGIKLSKVCSLSTAPDMALYVQWMKPADLIFSDSSGKLNLWNIDSNKTELDKEVDKLNGVTSSQLHDYFVWFVHFDENSDIVYSGDDSGLFRTFHLDHFNTPAFHRKRQFDTGVTSILTKGDIVAVGCYDDYLRIFTRNIEPETKYVSLSLPLLEMDLKGTVWRTMWIPPLRVEVDDEPNVYKLGVAAGRNGIHVINFNRSDWTWETTLCCLDYREELAYGIDIQSNDDESNYTVATCYFDTHRLHIFTMKP